MWTDEFHTLNATLLPWKDLITERLRAGHLPTYFLFMKVWTQLFGTSDWALRLPSALAGALIVPATYYFARPWFASRFVWVLVAVATVNATGVWASQEARMYSMLLVAATFAHGAFLRAVARDEQRAWITYWISAFIATALQPVMILTVVAHGLFLTVCHGRRAWPLLRKWLAVLIVVVPLLIAVALLQQKRSVEFDPREWLSETGRTIGIFVKRLGLVAFGVSADTGRWRALTSLILFLCLGLAYLRWRKHKRSDPAFKDSPEALAVKFSTIAVAFPVLALFMGSFFLEHIAGNERYLIPTCVPLWTLAIWGCFEVPTSRWRDVVVAAAVIMLAVGLIRHWRDRGLGGREIVHYVNSCALPSDVIVCRATPTMRLMIEHYSQRPLQVCTVPETSRTRDVDDDTAYQTLLSCLGPHTQFWLIEYRGKGSFLRNMIARRPKELEVVREKTIEQARAALIRRRSLQ
jgi:4-amino-4-deoxy-L-arabinose transferase-like glycosyltransferase